MDYSEEFLGRFWSKVHKTDTCWLWMDCLSMGYGHIKYKGKLIKAHRVSLELQLGRPIADGMVVAHAPIVCHNTQCVNPAHLREATRSENMLDMNIDGTATKRFGKDSTTPRRFNEEQIQAIRADDRRQRIIAEQYGVGRGTIKDIKLYRTYKWVTD